MADVYKPWYMVTYYLPTTMGHSLLSLPLSGYTFSFTLSLCFVNANSFSRSQLKLHFHKEAFSDSSDYIRVHDTHSTYFLGVIHYTTWMIISLMSVGLLDYNKLQSSGQCLEQNVHSIKYY